MQIQGWYSHEELPSLIPCGQLKKWNLIKVLHPSFINPLGKEKNIVYSPLKDQEIQKGNYLPREHSKPLIKLGVEINVLLKSLSIIFTIRLYQLCGRAVSFFPDLRSV